MYLKDQAASALVVVIEASIDMNYIIRDVIFFLLHWKYIIQSRFLCSDVPL